VSSGAKPGINRGIDENGVTINVKSVNALANIVANNRPYISACHGIGDGGLLVHKEASKSAMKSLPSMSQASAHAAIEVEMAE
jgi:hypothetical protein